MKLTEINLFGVYVAPIAPMIIVAWMLLIPVRRFADRFGLYVHSGN
jgi:protein AaeX